MTLLDYNLRMLLRPFFWALLFFGIFDLTLGLAAGRWLDEKAEVPLEAKLEQLARDNPEHMDVLLMGSSKTNNGFATDVFEKNFGKPVNVFNYGLPASEFDFYTLALKERIERDQKPKAVAVEVSDFMLLDSFSTTGLYYCKLMFNDSGLMQDYLRIPTLSAKEKLKTGASMASSVYRYNTLLSPLMLGKTFGDNPEAFKKGKMTQGWQPLETTELAINKRLWALDNLKDVRFERLERFLQYAKQEQVPVTLIIWPDHPRYMNLFMQRAESKTFYEGLEKLSAQYNVPLVNMQQFKSPGNPDTLFADLRHLNRQGAEAYTRLLAKTLSQK